jgi:hypothetical protein
VVNIVDQTTPSKFDFIRILPPLLEKRRGNLKILKKYF